MRTSSFHSKDLVKWLKRNKIATIDELKGALGTDVNITVYRKLRELSYHTSYSHRGGYYTLDEVDRFDDQGLWSYREVRFSMYGNLMATAAAFVKQSEAGYYAGELEHVLQVGVKETLLKLVRQGRISRKKISGLYLYCATSRDRIQEQLLGRRIQEAEPSLTRSVVATEILPDELNAAIVLFFSLLNEKQRRLYAGLESIKWGHGGDRKIADLLGLDVGTVAKGRCDLLTQEVERESIRKAGGGRKSVKKNA
jgi:hypothetical protein